ncbi:sigma-70 family RNA polymerase sigma factor [Cryptosporangium aurantiacum]|uniref:RNA polymerase sigma factor n=1 Tax=Cryptosporangium aurantiacum TaxID=134849 RepID=A0A1M7QE24_9ACTN|nr:sigma-70 family RNA polymerase sigma factor [Cryptosporangium aurantiacum]SHN29016.1 RNA polymerase sigma-70 factor, ECF subfamily [Cryptosporangium aurantiacum]
MRPFDDVSNDDVTEWALRAQQGDALATAAFVRATQADVWRFCASLVDADAADDLTQETYLRAFRALPGFAARASVRTWLLGIARRTCADHLRSVIRRRRLDDVLRARVPKVAAVADPSATSATADLLERLPPERRSAFVLTQLVGLSYQEAAAVEDVPIGTIRSRVARARDDLTTALQQAATS